MPTEKSEKMVRALEDVVARPLTDEESASVEIWSKAHDLEHFVTGFPQEWERFKEMLLSYLSDFEEQWDDLKGRDPRGCGDLAVQHAQLYGANKVVRTFIQDVEAAPERIREVPEIVKQNASQLRATPA